MVDLGTVHAVGDRWMLRYERALPHSVERVWRMVTTPEGLSQWFPARVEIEALRPGAAMKFTFSADHLAQAEEHGVEDVPVVSEGVVREVTPPHVFAFEWINEPVRIELHPTPEGCRLVFTHTFDRDREQAPRNAVGWHVCLEALEAVLAGRDAPALMPTPELEALYADLALPNDT